jgi:predicted PurR-regulated permease PerM
VSAEAEPTPIRIRPGELAWALGPLLLMVWSLYLAAELAWACFQLVLLLCAATLVAILVSRLASLLNLKTGLPIKLATVVVVACVALLLLVGIFVAGSQIVSQFSQLSADLPATIHRWREAISQWDLGKTALEFIDSRSKDISGPKIFGNVSGIFSTAFGFLSAFAYFLAIAFYLSIDARLYRRGLLLLIKNKERRRRAHEVLTVLTDQLWMFLLGQMCTMTCLAVLTTSGLWLLHIPSFLALGLTCGGLAFIPVVGAVMAFIPAFLIASTKSTSAIVSVIALYGGVQFLEGNFLTPMIQRRMASIPPVLLLTAQAVMGLLFGLFGVALAAPATVAVMVLVNELYLKDEGEGLKERTVAVVTGDAGVLVGQPEQPSPEQVSGSSP